MSGARMDNALLNAGANNHEIPLPTLFAWRMRSTAAVKRQFDQELANKEANFKCSVEPPEGLADQIKYFKMFRDLYQQNVNLMTSVKAYLDQAVLGGDMNEETERRMYAPLIKWLENMEKEMRRVLGLPTSEFVAMLETLRRSFVAFYKDFRSSVAANPKAYFAAVGGFGGALLMHKYFTGVCISGKILGWMAAGQCGACVTLGWATAFACGALGGVFLVCAFKAMCYAFSPEEREVQEEIADQFKDVHAEVEMVKEALSRCQDDELLRQMNSIAAFWDHFETFSPEKDDHECPVCLEPLREPVLFRGCVGRHFHCKDCRDKILAKNAGGGLCTLCRQPRPQWA